MDDTWALRWALRIFGVGALGNFALYLATRSTFVGLMAAGCAVGAALTAARLRRALD